MSTLAPERPAGAPAHQRSRPLAAVLAAVGIPVFMVTLDNLVVTTALPVIRTELGASITDLQWFVNAYTLPFAAFLLTAAALGDRIGRRRGFLGGIVLFTLASAAAALAAEPGQPPAAAVGGGAVPAHRRPGGAGRGRCRGRAAVTHPAGSGRTGPAAQRRGRDL